MAEDRQSSGAANRQPNVRICRALCRPGSRPRRARGIDPGSVRNRRSLTSARATQHADLQGSFYGSDGTRTRCLRRDRPIIAVPGWAGIGGNLRSERGFPRIRTRGFPGRGGGFRRPRAGCARDGFLPDSQTAGCQRDEVPYPPPRLRSGRPPHRLARAKLIVVVPGRSCGPPGEFRRSGGTSCRERLPRDGQSTPRPLRPDPRASLGARGRGPHSIVDRARSESSAATSPAVRRSSFRWPGSALQVRVGRRPSRPTTGNSIRWFLGRRATPSAYSLHECRRGSSVDDVVDRFRFEVNRTVDRVQVHAGVDRRVRPAAALARRTR
jgi:hypothetical protein